MKVPPPHRPLISGNVEYLAQIVKQNIFVFAFVSFDLYVVVVAERDQPSRVSVFTKNHLSRQSDATQVRQKVRDGAKEVIGVVEIHRLKFVEKVWHVVSPGVCPEVLGLHWKAVMEEWRVAEAIVWRIQLRVKVLLGASNAGGGLLEYSVSRRLDERSLIVRTIKDTHLDTFPRFTRCVLFGVDHCVSTES